MSFRPIANDKQIWMDISMDQIKLQDGHSNLTQIPVRIKFLSNQDLHPCNYHTKQAWNVTQLNPLR